MAHLPKTLVIGANGKTGRRVAEQLTARDWPVRRGSRSGTPPFDWNDASTWPDALRGMQQVYVTYQPDLAVPGAAATIEEFSELARDCGVEKLVLLSGRGEEGAVACEQVVRGSGLAWTIVRASWFAQNFSEGHFLEPIRAGQFSVPAGSIPEPFVDIDDVAEVAAEALMSDAHAGRLYEVTGPHLLTFEEAVAEISRASHRDIRYQQVSADDYLQMMVSSGVAPDFASFLVELMTTVLDGRNAQVTDGVERALGRPPRAFAEYADATARTGLWSVS